MKYTYFISYAISLDNGSLSFDNGIFPLENKIKTLKDIKDIEKTITANSSMPQQAFTLK